MSYFSVKAMLRGIVGLSLFFSGVAVAAIDLPLLKSKHPGFDWPALEKGEVVWSAVESAEVDDAALVTITAVKLPASMSAVLSSFQRNQPGVVSYPLNVDSPAELLNSLSAYHFSDAADSDISWFYDPDTDGTFNINEAELQTLKNAALSIKDRHLSQSDVIAHMEGAVHKLLAARVQEYLSGGIDAISPYDVDGDVIEPGRYLRNSLKPLRLLKSHEGDFYQSFLNYPACKALECDRYEQDFILTSEKESGRPVVTLKHWMIEARKDFTLIAERKFYISHSLDAMHSLIFAFEENGQTYLFLLNQSFTQKVTGMGSYIGHKIGRSKVKQNIVPLFEQLQKDFPRK